MTMPLQVIRVLTGLLLVPGMVKLRPCTHSIVTLCAAIEEVSVLNSFVSLVPSSCISAHTNMALELCDICILLDIETLQSQPQNERAF